jgi:hypothetical protein
VPPADVDLDQRTAPNRDIGSRSAVSCAHLGRETS